jgi:chitodextrinase
MKRILVVLAMVVTSALLTSPQANAAELLVNGGLESGSLSPWSCSGTTGSVVSSPVHSGTKALQGAATDQDNAQCTQTVSVVSGSSYTLSGWFRGNYTYIGIVGGASTWTPGGTSWTQLSLTFTASSSSVTVYTHGWYAQGAYQADDLSLQGAGGGGGTVPGAPSGLNVTGTTNSSISLSWTASSGTVTGYRVYEGTTVVSTGTGTTATISSLATCTSHTYFVRAYNSTGESPNSNSVTGTTTGCSGVPGAPSNLQVTGSTSSSISLSWAAGSGTITGYRVYEGSTQRAQVTGLSATISGLAACTSHSYVVRAYNASGESPNSNSVTGSTTGVHRRRYQADGLLRGLGRVPAQLPREEHRDQRIGEQAHPHQLRVRQRHEWTVRDR